MIEDRDVISPVNEGTPRWLGIAVVVLAGVSLLALGIGWSASNSARTAEQSLANEVKPLRQNVEVLTQRLTKAEETNAQLQGEFNVVTDRLQLTQGELQTARRQSKQIREDYSKKLSTVEASVKGELATKASADDVKALSGDVSGVRSDLEATKHASNSKEGTVESSNLKPVTGGS
jgi:outer membrane murein-binding lipoprotein Lpp